MELYLVRHGETESNTEKRYRGWTESPLTPEGIRQAEEVGYFLAGQNIKRLFCSDLKRAEKTARVIGAGSGLEPVVTPLLREINFGHWEGFTYDELEMKFGDAIRLWFDDPFKRAAPGGETLTDVYMRMEKFLVQLINETSDGERIAAVSHGGSIRALLFKILNPGKNNFWDIKIDNASVSLIHREGSKFKVVYYNRSDYLLKGINIEEPGNGYNK